MGVSFLLAYTGRLRARVSPRKPHILACTARKIPFYDGDWPSLLQDGGRAIGGESMPKKDRKSQGSVAEPAPAAMAEKRTLPPAAARALKEAAERRKVRGSKPALPPEKGGRNGPEPTRYGDWEKNGIASDF